MKTLRVLLLVPALLLASSAERRARVEYSQVTARAAVLLETIRGVEDRLREHGLSLHGDIVEARALTTAAIVEVEDAMREQKWTEARERLVRARACLDRLKQKF